jgi:hypothetical protein
VVKKRIAILYTQTPIPQQESMSVKQTQKMLCLHNHEYCEILPSAQIYRN